MFRDRLFKFFVLALSGFLSVCASAQDTIPIQADQGDIYDNLGAAVHLDGDRAVIIPARGRFGGGDEIFVFARDTAGRWMREAGLPSGWRNSFPILEIPAFRGSRGNWKVVSFKDPWLIVGNPHHSVPGAEDIGEVRIYRRTTSGWGLHGSITTPVETADSGFGISTAFDGTWLAAGQPGTHRAYMYRLTGTTFSLQQVIQPPGGGSMSGFGSELAFVDGQLVARVDGDLYFYNQNGGTWSIGQFLSNADTGLGASNPFAVDGGLLATATSTELRLFRRVGGLWSSVATGPSLTGLAPLRGFAVSDGAELKLAGYVTPNAGVQALYWQTTAGVWSGPNPIPVPAAQSASVYRLRSSYAGFSFAFQDSRLFMGARLASFDRVLSQGAAYQYRLDSGAPVIEQTFRHGNGYLGDNFGKWVSVDGDWMLATALGADQLVGNATLRDVGAAHLYRRDPTGWTRVQTLTPPTPQAFEAFGQTATLKGDLAIIGSFADVQDIDDHGRMYVFRRQASNEWQWLCELAPPVATVNQPLAWRNSDVNLVDSYPIEQPVSDGENIVALYRNRAYAWRTTPTECTLTGEIPIPDRGAPPGDVNTQAESQLSLTWYGGMVSGRLLIDELGGLMDDGMGGSVITPNRSMVYDFNGTNWVRSHLYTAQSGDGCGVRFGGSFVTPTSLRSLCATNTGGTTTWSLVTWVDDAGAWQSTVTALPVFPAGELPRGYAGNTLITEQVSLFPAGVSSTFRARDLPDYSVVQTLAPTAPCLQGHVVDSARFGENDVLMPCRQADGAFGRRTGNLTIFSRNLPTRGTGSFSLVPQIEAPPPQNEMTADGFEGVPP